jgi:hypothetical protein
VKAGSVIKALDVIEDGGGGFIPGHEFPGINQLEFENSCPSIRGNLTVLPPLYDLSSQAHPESYWGFRSRFENRETRNRRYIVYKLERSAA